MEAANHSHARAAEENDQLKVVETDIPTSVRTSVEDDELVQMESEKLLRTSNVTDENDVRAELDDFFIANFVSHKINHSRRHAHAKLG